MVWPLFRPVAAHALLVEFGDAIADDTHAAVLQLDRSLAETPFSGFREAIPGFVNLLVDFDPLVTDHTAVEIAVRSLFGKPAAKFEQGNQREILVCYDETLAPDLVGVAARTGLSPEAVVNAHLGGDYRVFMFGFAPGYAYLGGVPAEIQLPRKPTPLRGIAAGSVLIAGPQCIVTTLTLPTGWWIIGRSPTRMLTGEAQRPVLVDVGDTVVFRRISRADFDAAVRN